MHFVNLSLCDSQKISMHSKGIYVIIQKLLALFAKSFNIGSIFKFMKGFLANILAIITLAALLQISPKFIEFCYQKGIFLN